MSETRETAHAGMQQAISGLVGDIASVRAEDTSSFAQKNSRCEFFCANEKKCTTLPQANLAFIWLNAQFDRPPRNSR
jgi:hypothetical protein